MPTAFRSAHRFFQCRNRHRHHLHASSYAPAAYSIRDVYVHSQFIHGDAPFLLAARHARAPLAARWYVFSAPLVARLFMASQAPSSLRGVFRIPAVTSKCNICCSCDYDRLLLWKILVLTDPRSLEPSAIVVWSRRKFSLLRATLLLMYSKVTTHLNMLSLPLDTFCSRYVGLLSCRAFSYDAHELSRVRATVALLCVPGPRAVASTMSLRGCSKCSNLTGRFCTRLDLFLTVSLPARILCTVHTRLLMSVLSLYMRRRVVASPSRYISPARTTP